MVTVQSINNVGALGWFDDIEYQDTNSVSGDKLPFKMRVLIPGYDITPRNDAFEWVLDYGRGLLEPVLRHQPLMTDKISWVLPERWLSVHEQRLLIWQLLHHPDAKAGKIKTVDIITQNPLIVTDCPISLYKMDMDGGGDGMSQEEAFSEKK